MLIYRDKMISPQHLASDIGFAKKSTIHLSVKGLGVGGDGESESGESEGLNIQHCNYYCYYTCLLVSLV